MEATGLLTIEDGRFTNTTEADSFWVRGKVSLNIYDEGIYDEGQAYTEHDYRTWLTVAGFTRIERVSLTGGISLITAHKPT